MKRKKTQKKTETPMSSDTPLYMISVAAELAGMHPQTLRVYEQKGLVNPGRSSGNTRMYSQDDIERLNLIAELTREGINLAGVMRILDLMERQLNMDQEIEAMMKKMRRLENEAHELRMQRKIYDLVPYEEQDPKEIFCALLGKKLGEEIEPHHLRAAKTQQKRTTHVN